MDESMPAQNQPKWLDSPLMMTVRLSQSQLEVRWPLHGESYALLTFLATPCS